MLERMVIFYISKGLQKTTSSLERQKDDEDGPGCNTSIFL
jgi:hypothetical protein